MFKAVIRSPWTGAAGGAVSSVLGGLSWAGLWLPSNEPDQLTWLAIWFGATLFFFSWALVAQSLRLSDYSDRFKPKAALKYDPCDETISVQPGKVTVGGGGGDYQEFKHHVGVVNLSNETLTRMRLVLEEASPHANHVFYLGRPMTVRGEAATSSGYFDLPPNDGKRPSRYVEFMHQLIPVDKARRTGYRMPYAVLNNTEQTKLFFDRTKRLLVYRLEGGGLPSSVFFRIEILFNESEGKYTVTVL